MSANPLLSIIPRRMTIKLVARPHNSVSDFISRNVLRKWFQKVSSPTKSSTYPSRRYTGVLDADVGEPPPFHHPAPHDYSTSCMTIQLVVWLYSCGPYTSVSFPSQTLNPEAWIRCTRRQCPQPLSSPSFPAAWLSNWLYEYPTMCMTVQVVVWSSNK